MNEGREGWEGWEGWECPKTAKAEALIGDVRLLGKLLL